MSARSRKWRHLAEYVAFRMVACVIDALPWRVSVALSELLAFVFVRVLPRRWTRHRVACENLRRAFGPGLSDAQCDRLVEAMWTHLFRLVAEIVQLPRKLRLGNCADVIRFRHRDHTVRALCSGRPVIVLSGHLGNWEMANALFGVFGFRLGVVARDLDNPLLHAWFARFRRSTGHAMISKNGGGDDMVRILQRHGIVALLGDQDAGPKGMFVDFFGHPASTFKSIALLAVESRAVICVGYAVRLPDDDADRRWVAYEFGCEDVIDPLEYDGPDRLREITQRYTSALERIIRRAPEQYFWVHRRWKSEPRRRPREADALQRAG